MFGGGGGGVTVKKYMGNFTPNSVTAEMSLVLIFDCIDQGPGLQCLLYVKEDLSSVLIFQDAKNIV